MPPAAPQRRSDIKLLLGAGIAVLLGGIVIAAAILAITARGTAPTSSGRSRSGSEVDIHDRVRAGDPSTSPA